MKEATLQTIRTLNKYKVYIGTGIGVSIAIAAGVTFFVTQKVQKTESAWQALWKINNDLAAASQPGRVEKDRNAALSTAAEAYKHVRNTMSSSSASPWVLFQLGNVCYSLKNYDEAVRAYNEFLEKYSSHPLVSIVKQSLGYAYEEKGQFQEAVRQFDEILAQNNFLAAQVKWDAGRCYEKLNQTSDAVNAYTKVIELSPNSNWATMAQYRLSALK
ncbi:MAG: tetratricopeptide repeat protein [Candidatus Brocadiaceae bacterium]